MKLTSVAVSISDPSGVAEARRRAYECALALHFDAQAAGKVALVATELATNLVKHAGSGSLILAPDDETETMTLLSIDRADGIANISQAMNDGYSTAGSPGTGLGAAARKSDTFDVYSIADKGTVVLSRVAKDARKPAAVPLAIAGLCFPIASEEQSGDGWTVLRTRDTVTIVVADGLGHGPAAATASTAFLRAAMERPEAEPEAMIRDGHGALRSTRGAAVGITRIHLSAGRADFAGVGNIAGAIVADDKARRFVSHNGIVGHELRKAQAFSYPFTASSVLVMCSDGIGTSWSLSNYPGLALRDPAVIAAVIYRDFCRGTDDATVVVAKVA